MKIFKRLLRITRIALLVILALYTGAALVLVNLSDSEFKPAIERATHDKICYNHEAVAAAGTVWPGTVSPKQS
jgi:hypothetical protein